MDQDACEEIVSLNIAADCNEALVAFEEAGFCEEGTSGSGSGSEPESAACEALSECCMGIPTGNPAEALCTEGSVSPSTCSCSFAARPRPSSMRVSPQACAARWRGAA